MDQRVSLITLAVDDLGRATGFYEALGWRRVDSSDGIVVFDLIGQVLGLYPRARLAEDMGVATEALRGSGVTLSYNVRGKDEVATLYQTALSAGARGIRQPHDIFWGGYVAYAADPDGHVWEFAWNPFSPLGPRGEFQWNGAA